MAAEFESYWLGRKVVVTGAGGFIGSHLVSRLVAEGARVKALVHYNSRGCFGNLEYVPAEVKAATEVVFGNVRDPYAMRALVEGSDTVFHLAALIGIPYSYVNPNDVVETNVLGTLNMLNAARDCGVHRLIITSTSETYGTAQYAPIDECHPLQGQSPYSASKIGADKLAESYYRSFSLPVATVRPFNTYGPRQSTRAIIPTVLTQALAKKTIHVGSLIPRRDFTYVSDTVAGFVCVAASDRCLGEVINIGTGFDVSVGDLIATVQKITGHILPLQVDEERVRPANSEVMRLVCDNRKAKLLADWEPAVSLEEGLTRTAEWIRAHMELYPRLNYAI
jgi:NAD dependent epimerase/dehydratase